MTVAENLVEFLKANTNQPFCDDCIAESMNLKRRQQSYHVTNVLGLTREYKRTVDTCSVCGSHSKIVIRHVR